jgi:hypothetical protein
MNGKQKSAGGAKRAIIEFGARPHDFKRLAN